MSSSSYAAKTLSRHHYGLGSSRVPHSNRYAVAEEFMILVVTAFIRTQIGMILHEFDGRDPA